jgi:cytosine permease
MASPATPELSPILRAELAGPTIERRSWAWTIGPAYAGVFIWEPFFDRLGIQLAGATSLGRLAAVSILAAIACYALLYLVPALSGWAARERVSLVGASTFGTLGSEWVAGVAVAFGAVALYAVSIFMALRLTLLGLIAMGQVAPWALHPWITSPFRVEPPVILLSAGFWIFITVAANGLRLTGVIVALMQVYTPVALVLLAVTALLVCPGLAAAPAALAAARPSTQGVLGGPALFQLIFGYFALSGLSAVDWGMAVRHPRDVRIGGWISIILAGSYGSILSLLTVAGAAGRLGPGAIDEAGLRLADPLTFHGAVFHGIGGIVGGAILMLFGLASLAPAVYAALVYSRRLGWHWPAIGRRRWAWMGAGIALVLVATSLAGGLETIFGVLGAVFAPAVGAMTADWLRRGGMWRGVRPGVNRAGLLAWGIGVLVGLVPTLGAAVGSGAAAAFQPAALFAYLAALVSYPALAALGLEFPGTYLPDVGEPRSADEVAVAPGRENATVRSFGSADGEGGAHAGELSLPEAGGGPGAS